MKTVLHVGCGRTPITAYTTRFPAGEWREIRLDIDAAAEPDIVADMRDMVAVATGSVDALFSANNLEHVHFCEVAGVVREFARVVRDGGFAVITVPDLQAIARLVADDRLTDTAYMSQMGPIRAMDMLFGLQSEIGRGNVFMAHKCGFTLSVLLEALAANGFSRAGGLGRPDHFDLWAIACKGWMPDEELQALANIHLPAGP
ncbi:methyltransferase domain-containing protein [Magnetospirillum sp. SS-4]|uniref:class I SAM-dependent methyltransferase n=1 Tax=Magnetospirillum sp. SS-4 TaxID=2681465 RepID=UPI001382C113